jgi:hypothetical protein
MMRPTVNIVTRQINYSRINNNRGFLAHWKLTFKLWAMVLNMLNLIKVFSPLEALYMIAWTVLVLALKTPWFLFLKPLGAIYSFKTTWVGTYQTRNEVLIKSSVQKHVAHKLFGITFLKYPTAMTTADWKYVSE